MSFCQIHISLKQPVDNIHTERQTDVHPNYSPIYVMITRSKLVSMNKRCFTLALHSVQLF